MFKITSVVSSATYLNRYRKSLGFLVISSLALGSPAMGSVDCASEAIRLDGTETVSAGRVELNLDRPGVLVLEGEGIEIAADPCGGFFGGRTLERAERRRVIAFRDSGNHAFALRASAPVSGRILDADPVASEITVSTRERDLAVTVIDFYADGGRHLGATVEVLSSDAYRAEMAFYLATRRRAGATESMLVARLREFDPTAAAKIEEEDVDPNTGGFAGPCAFRKIEEEDVDPNTGGFAGPCAFRKIEEEDVDPNTGGFAGGACSSRTITLGARSSGSPAIGSTESREGIVVQLLEWLGVEPTVEWRGEGSSWRLAYFAEE